jgi:hypothetical protein
MKKYLLLIASVLMLAACSTPKYAYYFDHYDYNSGKKKAESPGKLVAEKMLAKPDLSPLTINEEVLTADAGKKIAPVAKVPESLKETKALAKQYTSMSKTEKKEFRKELKTVVKTMIKAKKSGKSIDSIKEAKVMDSDLKMALIFTIVAIVLGAFYGASPAFGILSLISIVIAIVFFIQWIARQ